MSSNRDASLPSINMDNLWIRLNNQLFFSRKLQVCCFKMSLNHIIKKKKLKTIALKVIIASEADRDQ